MKILLLVLITLLSPRLFEQHPLYVMDAEDQSPIPLAEVYDSNGYGVLTDWNGRADFPIENVKLRVHALGYVDTVFRFEKDTILLVPSKTMIKEVFIYAGEEGPDTILGNPSEEDEFAFRVGKSFVMSFKSGLLISIEEPTVLFDVNFYVSRRTKRHSYYRIRIFSVQFDGDTIIQMNDIIDSSLVNQVECRRCWQKVKLPQEVLVSQDVLIAMEWIPEPGWVPQEDNDEVELHDMACTLSESGDPCRTYNGTEKLIPQCWEMLMNRGDEEKKYNMALFVNARILD
ncbi:MAG: hypothetical protein EP346_10920 [Bacteroidetes bacterium]|nr:MAG: hypothetical protein EP346_10920 [Bacteroidota bacterium]